MSQLWLDNPWLVVIALAAGVIVACVAIVFITDYLRKSQQAEIDASLKHDMLNRGMSAADIKTVLEASTESEAMRRRRSAVIRACASGWANSRSRSVAPASRRNRPNRLRRNA